MPDEFEKRRWENRKEYGREEKKAKAPSGIGKKMYAAQKGCRRLTEYQDKKPAEEAPQDDENS